MVFNAQKVNGGWIVHADIGSSGVQTKVVVKDNELIKNFKEFVENSKVTQLNEG